MTEIHGREIAASFVFPIPKWVFRVERVKEKERHRVKKQAYLDQLIVKDFQEDSLPF